jgi:hypothetical protein
MHSLDAGGNVDEYGAAIHRAVADFWLWKLIRQEPT